MEVTVQADHVALQVGAAVMSAARQARPGRPPTPQSARGQSQHTTAHLPPPV